MEDYTYICVGIKSEGVICRSNEIITRFISLYPYEYNINITCRSYRDPDVLAFTAGFGYDVVA